MNPLRFFRQVRTEAGRVTWPSRLETLLGTVTVLIMVALASVFFFLVDQVLSRVVSWVLELGR